MTDGELWSAWRIWMGVATVVVLIAATLLVIIWLTALGLARTMRHRHSLAKLTQVDPRR